MGILNIREAERGGGKAVIGIGGPSGSGKTFTALKIARGMVKNSKKIGLLDAENGRGSLYADILDGPFMIADLYPPFAPKRYSESIKEFQDAGIEVLVIDSVSHEWEGEGGCDDIANGTTNKIPNWIGAKREHKRFMNTLLQSNMHIICCIRAREKTDFKDPKKPVSLGMQPVCEKNFMFEMTASLLMQDEGKTQQMLKIPAALKEVFGNGSGYLGESTGKGIMDWVNAGKKVDPEVQKMKSELLQACEMGVAGLMALWNALDPKMQAKMKPHFTVYKAAAKEYDAQAADAAATPQDKLAASQANSSTAKVALP